MIFSANAIETRKNNVAQAWNELLSSEDCVLVCAGDPITKPGGLDQQYHYLPHPSYFWLTGYRLPSGVAAYNKTLGWTFFVRPLSQAELVWEGAAEFSEVGTPISELDGFLKKHDFKKIFSLGQLARASVDRGGTDIELLALKTKMDRVRRVKDAEEVALVRKVAAAATAGFKTIQELLHVGMTERQLQVEYEAEIFRNGAHGLPYTTLVGSGANAAILHSLPTQKIMAASDWVLVDAGAEMYDYCVDITRMFAVSGQFSSQQQSIYDLVKQAQAKAIEHARIGNEWHSVHTTSARVIADGLKSLNIMRGSVDAALDTGAISVFYPHGVGHLVGLRVRDTGNEENIRPQKYCGVQLRVDFKLQENYMITVEPGCYFIKALIMDPQVRAKYQDLINWGEAEKWLNLGGVRIEDDILITKNGADVLTAAIPK
ncbi:MAG: aminopeptidase P N-terminal domain-containing protein [Bdellovibrionaceae bacterium]|nr:aminopeptidase P N-terminal domain-containing protein [Pseudobdellovibrionaceae bacterium]